MRNRLIVGLVLVAIWLLLGPVAMAFDGCVGCELPCAQMACSVPAPALTTAPEAVTSANPQIDLHPVTATVATPELPPKYLLSAA
jgi:hypothetical protein